MKSTHIILIAFVLLVVVLVVAVLGTFVGAGTLKPQPIAFNHKLHLDKAQGITCADCHQFVTTETYAGLPSKYVCFDCHDPEDDEDDPDADVNQPKFATLMAFAKTDTDIPWHRVTASRDDVYFSHRRHVAVGKLDCRQCHPTIPERTAPPIRGPIEMSMGTCLTCHEEKHANLDCVGCHR